MRERAPKQLASKAAPFSARWVRKTAAQTSSGDGGGHGYLKPRWLLNDPGVHKLGRLRDNVLLHADMAHAREAAAHLDGGEASLEQGSLLIQFFKHMSSEGTKLVICLALPETYSRHA